MAETQNEEKKETKTQETEPKTPEAHTLTQEEINKLIEAARKQEKDKLYETISSLKTEVSNLTEAQKQEKEEKERIAAEAQKKADEERTAKLTAEERLAEQLHKFEERLAKEAEERENLKRELEEERNQAELREYRQRILESAGDDLVKELVTGNSKEEIDHSVARAKETYQSYFQAALKNAEGAGGRTKENITSQMPGPANPDLESLDEQDLARLRNIKADTTVKSKKDRADIIANRTQGVDPEYLKNREEILSKLGNVYKA